METLSELYRQFLQVGLLTLREAIGSGDRRWADAEIELLHNVPSLLCESNVERHRYYWFGERQHYLDWLAASDNRDAQSRMATYYQPIWREMEPALAEMFLLADERAKAPAVK